MIRLEKFDQSDFQILISWIDCAETLMQFAGPALVYPLTAEQLNASLSDSNRLAFAVVETNTENTIGHAEIYLGKETTYLARILIGEPQFRGRGIGREIVSQLLDYAFRKLNRTNVELNVFDWNSAAINCYENAGFIVNPNKSTERSFNGKTWIALNMTIDREKWIERSVI